MLMFIMSIKPRFANQVLDGIKRFELRRYIGIIPKPGDKIVIYASGHVQALIGEFTVGRVYKEKPSKLYSILKSIPNSGITKDHLKYICGSDEALAIEVLNPIRYPLKIKLNDLRMIIPDFKPPYSFQVLEEGDPLYQLVVLKLKEYSKIKNVNY